MSRFMEQNKHLHNSVKMMKLTFFAFFIFAIQINENLADVMVPCVHHKICYGDKIGTYGQCGNGRCIKLNEDGSGQCDCFNNVTPTPKPKPDECKELKMCMLWGGQSDVCGNGKCIKPYGLPSGWGLWGRCDCSDNVTPTPKPKPIECNQGQMCYGNAEICGDGECKWKQEGLFPQITAAPFIHLIRNKRTTVWQECDCPGNVAPTPKPKPTECKQGQTCTGDATICGDGECISKWMPGPFHTGRKKRSFQWQECDCLGNVTPTPKPKLTECEQGKFCTMKPEICGDGECKRGWGRYYQCDCSGNVTPTPKPKFCWEGFQGIECKKDEDCGERGSCKPWMWTDTKRCECNLYRHY